MSIEAIENLMERSGISSEDLAKRMYIPTDELAALLSGEKKFRRLHSAGLERASLSLALERRDPSFVGPAFQWQMLRYAMLVLQEQRPSEPHAVTQGTSDVTRVGGAADKQSYVALDLGG